MTLNQIILSLERTVARVVSKSVSSVATVLTTIAIPLSLTTVTEPSSGSNPNGGSPTDGGDTQGL